MRFLHKIEKNKGRTAEMKEEKAAEVYRLWVDTVRRIVSFHPETGAELMEFRDRDMFLRCIDGYTAQLYRYQ